jgi:hypothetical protein
MIIDLILERRERDQYDAGIFTAMYWNMVKLAGGLPALWTTGRSTTLNAN